jgi:amino acid permease
MVDSIIATMCLAVAFIYSGILGDVFIPLLKSAGLPDAFNFRTTNILVITTVFLFPLSLIKDLSGLAFTSILGFAAIIYTVLFVLFRSLDGTYALGGDGTDGAVSTMGRFLVDGVIMKPSFTKSSLWNLDFTSLILASNLGLAYIAHYNGPIFYRELKDTNSKKFGNMVSIAFLILTILYIAIMSAGYSTFGDTCQGNLLLNYHPSDILSTMGRLATGFSILFGYPLVICGAREGIMGAASTLGYDISEHHVALVSSILALVTFVACTVDNVSLVVGLTGAALGSFIVYICPSIIYSKAVGIVKGLDSKEYNVAKRNLAFVPFGILIGSLGCYMTIKESLSK